jgi:hypothetical protein
MAQGPRPFGRTKSLRVPAGKEDEYAEDRNGEPIHVKYGSDEDLQGIVVPSGKHFREGGGSHGFNVNDMDIPQNIVAFDENGQRTVTQVTRRELAAGLANIQDQHKPSEATPEEIARLGEQAENTFLQVSAAAQTKVSRFLRPETAPTEQFYNPFEEGVMAPKKKAKAKKAKKKSRRGGKIATVARQSVADTPPEQEAPDHEELAGIPEPPTVKISFEALGTISAAVSGVFRDGVCMVMYTDSRQLPSAYTFPEVDSPIPVTIEYDGHVVSCLWAGIQFTMPNAPVTFIVLLVVEEEQADGEGQPGQAGHDEM